MYGSRSHADVLCDSSDDDEFVTPIADPSLSSLLAAASTSVDPVSLREARASPNAAEWDTACRYELAMLEGMGTWSLVDLPPGRSAIPNKWVFKLKNDGRYRARLVAKGFKQVHGIDYDEVFSPVARFESLRVLFALAASHDWHIHSMDVKSAFLNGDIEEELYMQQPEGFEIAGSSGKVCHLHKSIYGLKQAARRWNAKMDTCLDTLDLSRITSDAGLYVKRGGDSLLILVLYVDDITIFGNDLEEVLELKRALAASFEMTDLGETTTYLGLEVSRDRTNKTMTLCQSRYITSVVARFGMAGCNAVTTPLPPSSQLVPFEGIASTSTRSAYQQIIGSLMYAAIVSRPDLAYAVNSLARYAANPAPEHLTAAKHVLRYLAGTTTLGLHYNGA